MLDRLKFMLGFGRAYRAARKSGASREDAQLAAARSMIGERLGIDIEAIDIADLPTDVAALWRDPEPALASDDADGHGFGSAPFEITPAHLLLLRQMRFSWDGAERGAPMLDPARPYSRSDVMAQLADVFPSEDAAALARRHVEMFFVLARVLVHGVLAPGRYALRNIEPDDVRAALQGYGGAGGLSDTDIGIGADGTVTVDDEHLKLLRNVQIRWPSEWDCEERLEEGAYPAATADSKRPYGDYTFIEIDMARILGRLPPAPPDGVFEPEPALAAYLQGLHWQMLGAMQAFVENAEFAPGVYDLRADGVRSDHGLANRRRERCADHGRSGGPPRKPQRPCPMLNLYLFIELLGAADPAAVMAEIKQLDVPKCTIRNAVQLADDKLVAHVDCESGADATRVVLENFTTVEGVVQTNIIAVVKPTKD